MTRLPNKPNIKAVNHMKSKVITVFLFAMVVSCTSRCRAQTANPIHRDYVPDSITAIKIAEAVWLPIYGQQIYQDTPFIARLDTFQSTWIIYGTVPKNTFGGPPIAHIQKSDGKILKIYHPR